MPLLIDYGPLDDVRLDAQIQLIEKILSRSLWTAVNQTADERRPLARRAGEQSGEGLVWIRHTP